MTCRTGPDENFPRAGGRDKKQTAKHTERNGVKNIYFFPSRDMLIFIPRALYLLPPLFCRYFTFFFPIFLLFLLFPFTFPTLFPLFSLTWQWPIFRGRIFQQIKKTFVEQGFEPTRGPPYGARPSWSTPASPAHWPVPPWWHRPEDDPEYSDCPPRCPWSLSAKIYICTPTYTYILNRWYLYMASLFSYKYIMNFNHAR